jgi:hypothetical protein
MNGPGRTVLEMCCASCFLPDYRVFALIALRKAAFSAILRCWVQHVFPLFRWKTAAPSGTQTKSVLKGIARVDDPFSARWSA